MLSDDGTDYQIAMNYAKPFHSHKFKKSALRYEVGVGIKSGDICWWWGPFEPGIWNDNMIFQSALVHELEEGEWVETDAGYKASAPEHVKCPGTAMSDLGNKEMSQRAAVQSVPEIDRCRWWPFCTYHRSKCGGYQKKKIVIYGDNGTKDPPQKEEFDRKVRFCPPAAVGGALADDDAEGVSVAPLFSPENRGPDRPLVELALSFWDSVSHPSRSCLHRWTVLLPDLISARVLREG